MLPAALDSALDRLVVPGYSRLGHAARRLAWRDSDPAPDALAGRTVVITGATSGIGRAAAAGCARLGATVVLVGRDVERTERARCELLAEVPGSAFAVELADISRMADVRALAGRLPAPLHAVVHNAGVMLGRRTETDEGNEATFATHVLGPHLLSRLLADPVPARTVWVSSGGMYAHKLDAHDPQSREGEWNPTRAYARTKRMQVVLAQEWARRTDGGVVHAMHPGWVDTPGLSADLPGFHRLTKPILRPPAAGADTIVWLTAADEPATTTGLFWHDRRPRPTHYLSRTREQPSEREALWAACEGLTS